MARCERGGCFLDKEGRQQESETGPRLRWCGAGAARKMAAPRGRGVAGGHPPADSERVRVRAAVHAVSQIRTTPRGLDSSPLLGTARRGGERGLADERGQWDDNQAAVAPSPSRASR